MTELENTATQKSFKFWFMLFALVTVVLIGYYNGLSVASAHSVIVMMFVRQMSHIWKTNKDRLDQEALILEQEHKLLELSARMDKIDPYKD